MSKFKFKRFYQGDLPHHQLEGCILAITLRLNFTLPKQILKELRQMKIDYHKNRKNVEEDDLNLFIENYHKTRYEHYDDYLDKYNSNRINLLEHEYLSVVKESLHFLHLKKYFLISYCVMSNHVHMLIKPLINTNVEDKPYYSLAQIMFSFKRYTSGVFKELPDYVSPFWRTEFYDHRIRDDKDFFYQLQYIKNNPVKAGLIKDSKNWPGLYECDLNDLDGLYALEDLYAMDVLESYGDLYLLDVLDDMEELDDLDGLVDK